MQTLEITGQEESVRLEIHPKRGLIVLRFGEKRSLTCDVPSGGIRLSFSNAPRIHLAEGWRSLSGLAESPDPADIVLTKVPFPTGNAWILLSTYQGVWAYAHTKLGQRW